MLSCLDLGSDTTVHLDEHRDGAFLLGQETDHFLVVVEPLDGLGQHVAVALVLQRTRCPQGTSLR